MTIRLILQRNEQEDHQIRAVIQRGNATLITISTPMLASGNLSNISKGLRELADKVDQFMLGHYHG